MERSILAELERAELRARERRLAAQAEADVAIEAAQQEAASILAGADQAVADAVGLLQDRHAAAAEQEVRRLDAGRAAVLAEPLDAGPGFERAVELVVRAVLAEGD